MRIYSAIVVVVVALLGIVGCHPGEQGHSHEAPPPDIDGLQTATAVWEVAFDAQDAAATAAVYSMDARVFPPEMPPVEGGGAIQDLMQGFFDGGFSVDLDVEEVDVVGDLGYRVGAYVLSDAEGLVIDEGHFVEFWRKIDGAWMMTHDIWNSDLAADDEGM
ncbi:MAG: DUF4440 domain-containing protein [Acidobacteriota bacterium]|nr:DUF4440 domain-containing protein [Acidobacteriota bacterium]